MPFHGLNIFKFRIIKSITNNLWNLKWLYLNQLIIIIIGIICLLINVCIIDLDIAANENPYFFMKKVKFLGL